ncbi:glycosyl hydrolase [Paenibacillus sp. GCM10027626]|uniref:glycosyl hydrolase n=1 Tax=Paenibacillus sp. GCM10027626 TaxID=3273411 RepID=UPI0036395496
MLKKWRAAAVVVIGIAAIVVAMNRMNDDGKGSKRLMSEQNTKNEATNQKPDKPDLPDISSNKQAAEKPPPFNEAEFKNPNIKYRPLLMIHENLHTGVIKKIKDLGYGGMVTNVPYQGYLQNEEYWEILKQNVEYAIDKLGLRVWIYDEKGYPSGTAGGLVLKERPDLEAQGLAVIEKEVAAKGDVVINHPQGHGKVVSVSAYPGSLENFQLDAATDLTAFLDDTGNLKWKAPDGEWVVFYFVQKPFYEGTHAVNNWYEQRRYINLLEKEATEKFIDVTHRQYFERLGSYFGKGIEAFFTDEPALTGTYLTSPPRQPAVLDQPDPDVPLLKTLNWGNQLADVFKQRRGYDLLPVLPYLAAGTSKEARQVRLDYYQTLAELVVESYFEPLEKFCGETGVACSGHLLLEEEMFHQAVYEGNLLEIYRHMQMPGIDLLTAYPKLAKEWAVTTAKLASSSAYFYGKEHVMSEISDAFDGEKADFLGRLAAIAVQFAFGVDHFNSYYEYDRMSDEENQQFANFVGRIGYMMDSGAQSAQIAVYYPVESVWEQTLPPMSLNAADYAAGAVAISNNFKQVALSLVDRQMDFNYLDTEGILSCKLEDGKLVTPAGQRYEALVIPNSTVLDARLAAKLLQIADAGIRLVVQGGSPSLIRTEQGLTEAGDLYGELAKRSTVLRVKDAAEVAEQLRPLVKAELLLDKPHPELITFKKSGTSGDTFLLVNTSDEAQSLSIQFNTTAKQAKLWDPITGAVEPLTVTELEGYKKASLDFQGRQTWIVTFEP